MNEQQIIFLILMFFTSWKALDIGWWIGGKILNATKKRFVKDENN